MRHHVMLGIVGTDRMLAGGYLRAKFAQEQLVKGGPIPFTIVRLTQFFEFVSQIVQAGGEEVRASPALIQPIAVEDAARALADLALAAPRQGTVEVGGPEAIPLSPSITG